MEPVDDGILPDPVARTLDELGSASGLELHLWVGGEEDGFRHVYPPDGGPAAPGEAGGVVREITPRDGPALHLEIVGDRERAEVAAAFLPTAVGRTYDFSQEVRFFTFELSERYEEINLLYSISETLGSILRLDDAANVILNEVTDVLGARRGSLWVYESETEILRLTAHVGEEGLEGPLRVDDPEAVTSQVFREGRSTIETRPGSRDETRDDGREEEEESFLSVPIRYTPPAGEARTVGVINLIGRRHGGRFTASDQKLLSAIASQVGAALENNRLIQESLARERVAREMELAHNLQMKLLPSVESFDLADVAGRVQPAESVGGDFYHLIRLSGDRIGIMIGDVSSHGFSAALIMALSISAATIYATEFAMPARVLRSLHDSLEDELESTEMYLTLFYGVLDPESGTLAYSNAGHPHAFLLRPDGSQVRLDATDPPVGIAGPDSYGEQQVEWQRGEDLLLLFTDGLSDAFPLDGAVSGEDRIVDEARKRFGKSSAEIVDALFAVSAGARPDTPSDDRTAIILR